MFSSDVENGGKAIIKVLAAGDGGARAVGKMRGRIQGIELFGTAEELSYLSGKTAIGSDSPTLPGTEESVIESLRSVMRGTDLAFVVTYIEDESVAFTARLVSDAARMEGAMVIGVIAEYTVLTRYSGFDSVLRIVPDCIFPANEQIPLIFGSPSLVDYLMRHAIEQITLLIIERGLICIDYADVKAILTGDGANFMGIGVAGGAHKGSDAAFNALKGVKYQGVDMARVNGVLACFMGSTNMTMEEFDDGIRVIHESTAEVADIICGCHIKDLLGDNMKVTVFTNFAADTHVDA